MSNSRRNLASSLRAGRAPKGAAPQSVDMRLERAKSLATIFSAVAIPIVLAVAGYYVQNQLSSEGIRKDYVGIATAILKEKAENQEPDLRAWAVKILDDNAPIPFTKKAKESLLAGTVVTAGPAWLGPPDGCRKPPPKRTILQRLDKLSKDSHTLEDEAYLKRLIEFAKDVVVQEEGVANMTANLNCLQDWVSIAEKVDIEFRESIGAPTSKSVWVEFNAKKAASAASASASAASSINPVAKQKPKLP